VGIDGQPFVFEVRPGFRGDIARAHFYFAVRYDLNIPPAEEVVLREWHCADPPDLEELIRNDLVENAQQNRNPFVDRPRLVDAISDF
jgi:endonuclease I